MKDYELDLKIKNAPLLNMMRSEGIETPAELARIVGMSATDIGRAINLQKAAYTSQGKLCRVAEVLCDYFAVSAHEIWPEDHLYDALEVNRIQAQVTKNQLIESFSNDISECPSLAIEALQNESCKIDDMTKNLLPREARVIKMIFKDELTHKEIGQEIGVSGSRVMQIQARALRKLRNPKKSTCVLNAAGNYGEEYRA